LGIADRVITHFDPRDDGPDVEGLAVPRARLAGPPYPVRSERVAGLVMLVRRDIIPLPGCVVTLASGRLEHLAVRLPIVQHEHVVGQLPRDAERQRPSTTRS
jgi:hypothetical protein